MKKLFVTMLTALILNEVVFAQNHTNGLDIQLFGIPIGITTIKNESDGSESKTKILETGHQLKIATYNCFLLNNILGVYASVGANTSIIRPSNSHPFIGISGEFMVGPAFGVNLGRTRLQTGLAFHSIVALGIGLGDYNILYNTLGFALTPQFRFTADRRCSFLLGCDFTFDFPRSYITYGYTDNSNNYEKEVEFDSSCRFGMTPYIGLGINF